MKANYIILLLIISTVSFAQKERKYIRSGNSSYKSNDYSNAEVEYSKAINENDESFDAAFNLGDALYREKKFDQAEEQFSKLSTNETSKENLSKAFHNLGNSQLQQKKYEEAIESYKSALRNSPKDMDTKYNLAYAKQMLKKQQQQQKQNKDNKNNKDKKDNKDKKNDKKNDKDKKDNKKNKKDNKKNKQDQQNQNKDKKQKQKKQEQQKMSKKEAEQMLKSIQNDEKKLQKKLKGKKVKGQKVKVEKDW